MRVLHCIPSMEGGGAERQLMYLAGQLAAGGCDVHIALTRRGAYFERLRATGAALHDLGPCHTHDPRLLPRLVGTIRRVRPDVVQCWLLQMEVLGGVASLATRTPWIFSERSSALAYPATLKNAARRHVAARANGIVANSEGGRRYWKAALGPRAQVYVVRNGLPLDEIDAVAPAPLPGGERRATIVYAGRFDEGKNAFGLIQALSRVRAERPVCALLMGEGPLRRPAEALAVELGLADRVQVTGFAPNLWGILKSATMLVSLSRFEGSPNVVLEAMACGCPLVVSDIPAHRELLDEGSAVFADADDPDGVAGAIGGLLADPAAARARAMAARARADLHALPLVGTEYMRVYADVLARAADATRRVS
jgi:glycosyltransferase involved in cell wall biosynthesis